jgi:TldD protein
MHRWMMIGLGVCLLAAPALAENELVQKEMGNDVVLRALVDELDRSKAKLTLQDFAPPYFIEYALLEGETAYVTAEFGATTFQDSRRQRTLRTDVRVGSYELDNTNFSAGYGRFGRRFGGGGGGSRTATMPIENDYLALRQAIWWETDRGYKDVLETFESKKAEMKTKLIEDKPPDFAHAKPAVHFDKRMPLGTSEDRLAQIARPLSAVFRDFPEVKDANVTMGVIKGNVYLVNSEGTRLRTAQQMAMIAVGVTVQADDGMEFTDSMQMYHGALEDVPPLAELEKKCREMVANLIAIKDAPVLDSYAGPILCDKEAATTLFAGMFSYRFDGGQRPVGSRTSPDDFENKLDRRILPRSVNVYDDPTLETLAGKPVLGHYAYDDQGVPAQRVSLVEEGRLKKLLMSRNPGKTFRKSNGHGRGLYNPSASVGCLVLTSDDGMPEDELKQELLEACQDEGLEFGIRISSFGSVGGGRGGMMAPLRMYKVYTDGREELVRGAQIAQLDLPQFKRLLAFGEELHVLNSGSSFVSGQTIAAPAMLFEELDLAKIDEDFDKPPILPSPLAEMGEEK